MSVVKFPRTVGTTEQSFVTLDGALTTYTYYLLVSEEQDKAARALRYLSLATQVPDLPAVLDTCAPASFWDPCSDHEKYCQAKLAERGGRQQFAQLF